MTDGSDQWFRRGLVDDVTDVEREEGKLPLELVRDE